MSDRTDSPADPMNRASAVVAFDTSSAEYAAEIDDFRVRLAHTLRTTSDPAEIEAAAVELLGRHLGVSRCYCSEVESDDAHFRISREYAAAGVPRIAGRYRIADFGAVESVTRAGRALILSDTQASPLLDDAPRAAFAALDVQAAVAMPLLRDGRLVAVFGVGQATPRDWTTTEVALIQETAEHTWNAVERARAQEAMRRHSARFEALLEHVPLGVYLVDADFQLAHVNPIALALFGDVPGGMLGRDFADVVREMWEPAYADEVVRIFRHALETGEPYVAEERTARRRDRGTVESYEWRVDRITLPDGRHGLVCYCRDITAQVEARTMLEVSRDALRESEARFRSMADHAPVMVWMTDPEGRCTFLSQSWYEFTAQIPETGLGLGWLDALHPDDRQTVSDTTVDASQAHEAAVVEYRLRRHDGAYAWVIDSARPRRGAHGEFLGLIGSVLDITDRKRAEQQLQQSEADARLLQALSAELVFQDDAGGLYEKIVDAAAAIMHSQYATMQRYHPLPGGTGELRLLAHRGLSVASTRAWERVTMEGRSTCAMALRSGQREFVPDVERCVYMVGTDDLAVARAQGMRAAQSTPLTSRSGRLLGMISTHWDHVQESCEQDLLKLDIVARQAADLIERRLAADALRESRDVLSLVMRGGRIGAWSLDLQQNSLWWSRELEEVFGLEPGGFSGRTEGFVAFVHPEDRSRLKTAIDEAIATRSDYAVEFRFQHASGEWHWMEGRGRAVYGERGPAMLYGVGIDITDQKRATLESAFLAEISEALSDVRDLETSLDRLVQLSLPFLADWCIIDLVNDQGQLERGATGHRDPAKAPLMKELKERFPPSWDSADPLISVLRTAQPELHPIVDRARVRRQARGRDHWRILKALEPSSYMVVPFVARGAVFGAISLVRSDPTTLYGPADLDLAMEVARRVGAAIDNARLFQQIEAANRRKDEFLAILAHELRNPLAPIRTGLELLRLDAGKPDTLERVHPVIERQVSHMVRLVDDLLDVSRITSGRIQLRRQPLALNDLVANAVEASRASIDAAGLELVIRLPSHPVLLDVDPTRFVQVISNLLHNAAKFTGRGGRITISAGIDDDDPTPCVNLTVADTGVGIAPAMLQRIFELFVRGEEATAGLGIGLALSRQLIEMHGGRLEAASEGPGRGSAFTIRLPAIGIRSTETTNGEGRAPRRIVRRVLIIDDNVDAADMLAALVTALGGEAETANDGETGLERAAEFHPEVVLLDIGMPRMDGYATCRRLRAKSYGRQTYIVALTGWGQEQDKERALKGGFDAHLTKPADPRTLESLLADLPRSRSESAARPGGQGLAPPGGQGHRE